MQTDTGRTDADGHREDRYRRTQGGQIQTDTGRTGTDGHREDRYRRTQGGQVQIDRERMGSEIRTLRAFKDSDCTFGARVRKTAEARCCCIPELLALKWLISHAADSRMKCVMYRFLSVTTMG